VGTGFELVGQRRRLDFFSAWLVVGWCLIAVVVYLSLTPRPLSLDVRAGDKYGHFVAYFVLMLWFAQLYTRSAWRRLAVLFVSLGISLELMQGLTAVRELDAADMLSNGFGVLVAWSLAGTRAGRMVEVAERWYAGFRGG